MCSLAPNTRAYVLRVAAGWLAGWWFVIREAASRWLVTRDSACRRSESGAWLVARHGALTARCVDKEEEEEEEKKEEEEEEEEEVEGHLGSTTRKALA